MSCMCRWPARSLVSSMPPTAPTSWPCSTAPPGRLPVGRVCRHGDGAVQGRHQPGRRAFHRAYRIPGRKTDPAGRHDAGGDTERGPCASRWPPPICRSRTCRRPLRRSAGANPAHPARRPAQQIRHCRSRASWSPGSIRMLARAGHLGMEEIEVITPVLDKRCGAGMQLRPASGRHDVHPPVLARGDAVLAMYHDQGLTALKYATFGHGINVTLACPSSAPRSTTARRLELAGPARPIRAACSRRSRSHPHGKKELINERPRRPKTLWPELPGR